MKRARMSSFVIRVVLGLIRAAGSFSYTVATLHWQNTEFVTRVSTLLWFRTSARAFLLGAKL